jgi:hypothetical protein
MFPHLNSLPGPSDIKAAAIANAYLGPRGPDVSQEQRDAEIPARSIGRRIETCKLLWDNGTGEMSEATLLNKGGLAHTPNRVPLSGKQGPLATCTLNHEVTT